MKRELQRSGELASFSIIRPFFILKLEVFVDQTVQSGHSSPLKPQTALFYFLRPDTGTRWKVSESPKRLGSSRPEASSWHERKSQEIMLEQTCLTARSCRAAADETSEEMYKASAQTLDRICFRHIRAGDIPWLRTLCLKAWAKEKEAICATETLTRPPSPSHSFSDSWRSEMFNISSQTHLRHFFLRATKPFFTVH